MFVVVDVPTSTQLDGAVVELYVRDSVVHADVRIPALGD